MEVPYMENIYYKQIEMAIRKKIEIYMPI